MKNITVAVDDDTYRMARVFAAEHDTSVSALVRDYLARLAKVSSDQADYATDLFDALDKARGFSASDRLSRDEAHRR